ncbi:hypothetical protein N7449_008358 [Penicillium cf. viridicatum]|uniref:Uncharacterized protein n=1 Tax=Penicillium cf. viridicatum TaxID=2972119 RepID=A0A9W9JAB3_9EURO|nr:hypothetical protein N7449_008358 [Penicillium cf. viridicatum]
MNVHIHIHTGWISFPLPGTRLSSKYHATKANPYEANLISIQKKKRDETAMSATCANNVGILERKTHQTSGESESETRGARIKSTILNQTHQKSRRNGCPNKEVVDPARRTPLKLRGHWSHFGRETGTEQATLHPQYCTLARGHGLTPRCGREGVGNLTPSG